MSVSMSVCVMQYVPLNLAYLQCTPNSLWSQSLHTVILTACLSPGELGIDGGDIEISEMLTKLVSA